MSDTGAGTAGGGVPVPQPPAAPRDHPALGPHPGDRRRGPPRALRLHRRPGRALSMEPLSSIEYAIGPTVGNTAGT